MSVIYCGTLRVQTNAHIKPRGKRKRLRPDEMEFRDVHGVVWVGETPEQIQIRKHTIRFIAGLCNIKNNEAIRVVAIINKKEIGTTNQ
jgi:uncharacterized Fe-S cluster-containing protein